MLRIIFSAILLLLITTAKAQMAFAASKQKAISLPKNVKYLGQLKEAWKWIDNKGENILLVTATKPKYEGVPGDGGTTIELYAYLLRKKDAAYKTVWRMNDKLDRCELDHAMEFIKGSTQITDLDKDGIAEVTVQYKIACRGDVSPSAMKLIMHEDSVKYALRGQMWISYPVEDTTPPKMVTESDINLATLPGYTDDMENWAMRMGRYDNEKDFANAPPEFIIFARKRWLKHVKESFD